jgi:hypothetical protein
MCFVRISEQTAITFLYRINRLVFITPKESVYCAVRAGSLYSYIKQICFVLKGLMLSSRLLLDLLSDLRPSCVPTKTLYVFVLSHLLATCLEQLTLPDLISLIMYCGKSLRQADHPPRGVVPSVVCLSVIVKPR